MCTSYSVPFNSLLDINLVVTILKNKVCKRIAYIHRCEHGQKEGLISPFVAGSNPALDITDEPQKHRVIVPSGYVHEPIRFDSNTQKAQGETKDFKTKDAISHN